MTAAALDFVLDRPLPHDYDAERAVLGSILISAKAIARVINEGLTAEDFFRDSHRIIFSAFQSLENDGTPIELLTIKNALGGRLESVGGATYISSLMDGIPDVANVERYARIVKEKSRLRMLVAEGNRMMRGALDTGADSNEIAAEVCERLQLVRPAGVHHEILDGDDLDKAVEILYESGGVRKGFSTGLSALDQNYSVARGAWCLVTGIPSHGKSGFLDQLAVNLAKLHKWQTVMFSAENYPPESHIATLIEKYIGEPFNQGPTARMTAAQMKDGRAFVSRHFRFIDPAAEGMTIDRLLSIATSLAEQNPVDVLIIDPWNELHHERAKEFSETEYISTCLTKIRRWARKHDAVLFLVAHPAKMQKNSSGSYDVPTPYDVSGSAHWRNKADYCLAIWRDLAADDATVSVHVQKVRRREMGRLGQVVLRYNRITGQYLDPKAPTSYRLTTTTTSTQGEAFR